jgi:hypothetical protein
LWLEQAAASGSYDGRLYLAALLATAPVADGGDSGRAMKLIDEVFKGVKDDPTAHEIRAAAQANKGDFKAAVDSEREAIRKAQKLQWNLAPLQERLAAYTAEQPWRQPLLSF